MKDEFEIKVLLFVPVAMALIFVASIAISFSLVNYTVKTAYSDKLQQEVQRQIASSTPQQLAQACYNPIVWPLLVKMYQEEMSKSSSTATTTK